MSKIYLCCAECKLPIGQRWERSPSYSAVVINPKTGKTDAWTNEWLEDGDLQGADPVGGAYECVNADCERFYEQVDEADCIRLEVPTGTTAIDLHEELENC